ncbi:MAG: glycosyltransferase [Bacteroidota bacterium]|nr:glycosyltransferase [Bacteroidota bacterium]
MNLKGKKIIIIVPTLSNGGAERVAASLSLYFPDEVQVLYVLYQNDITYLYKGRIISLNIDPSKSIFSKAYNFLYRLLKLKSIFLKERPDAVISFMEDPNLINILLNKRAIISVREPKSLSVKNDFKNRMIIKKFYNRSKKIISVSKGIKEDLVNNFNIKPFLIEIIHNPVNTIAINNLAMEKLEDIHEFIFKNKVIICVGRLSYEKAQVDLLLAYTQLKDIPDLHLVLLGDGEVRYDLENIAREHNLLDKIHFLGFQKNPYKFIAKSTLFVLSSKWEGFPNVVLEAMACNIPVISSDCPTGPSEIFIDNKFKNLYQVGNIDELSLKLRTFLQSDNSDFLAWSKNRLLNFDPKIIAKQYLEVANES